MKSRAPAAWPLACLAAASLAAVATTLYAARHWQDYEKSYLIQGAGLAAAAIFALALARPLLPLGRQALRGLSGRLPAALPGVAILLCACALRYAELRFLPYSAEALFEEPKKAGAGAGILRGGPLPIEFRYTKSLTALGLSRGGDRLDALRFFFRVNGCASLLFLMLCLRALGAGWPPTAFVTITAATLPWLAVGGGVADESFAGLAPSLALLWLLAEAERSPARAAAWAAAGGILGGVLFYEYISFQATIVLAGGWLACRAVFPREDSTTPRAWLPLAAFLAAFCLVTAPAVAEILHAPAETALLNGLLRHRSGRTTPFVAETGANLAGYLSALFGLPCTSVECFAMMRQPMIPLAVGLLLAASFLAALFRPRLPLEWFIGLCAALSVAVAAALANNFNPQRVTATLSLLLLLSGTALERANEWLRRRGAGRAGAATLLGAAALAASVHFGAIRAMAGNKAARDCWVNNDYVMCRHVAETARPGQRVWVLTPQFETFDWSHPDVTWLFAGKNLEISSANGVDLARTPPPPGTLYVIGYRSGTVSDDDIRSLLALAAPSGDESSLRVSRNLTGRAAAASVCVWCR